MRKPLKPRKPSSKKIEKLSTKRHNEIKFLVKSRRRVNAWRNYNISYEMYDAPYRKGSIALAAFIKAVTKNVDKSLLDEDGKVDYEKLFLKNISINKNPMYVVDLTEIEIENIKKTREKSVAIERTKMKKYKTNLEIYKVKTEIYKAWEIKEKEDKILDNISKLKNDLKELEETKIKLIESSENK